MKGSNVKLRQEIQILKEFIDQMGPLREAAAQNVHGEQVVHRKIISSNLSVKKGSAFDKNNL